MKITEEAKKKIVELMEANKKIMPEHTFFLRITADTDADNNTLEYYDEENKTGFFLDNPEFHGHSGENVI
jgi:Fe-S cluster assembly iron-binding protein IscA